MTEANRIPIIKLWHLLLVPLQGEIEDDVAEELCDGVLQKIHDAPVSGLVVDVTGLWLMDSHLCAMLSRMARAAALMGTRTVICGMNAETTLTLQTMGLTLAGVETALSLEQALSIQGIRTDHPADDEDDEYLDFGGQQAEDEGD